MEAEDTQGTKYIDVKGAEPITRLPKYVPLWKGKVKVMKVLDSENFTISMPLLPKQVPFEGPWFMCISLLKIEDCDLVDHARFAHLATEKYMSTVYYAKSGVTTLEIEE